MVFVYNFEHSEVLLCEQRERATGLNTASDAQIWHPFKHMWQPHVLAL